VPVIPQQLAAFLEQSVKGGQARRQLLQCAAGRQNRCNLLLQFVGLPGRRFGIRPGTGSSDR
jgi:hypothetical protein